MMAANQNISHIQQELCHPACNANQMCCKNEDSNNNISNIGIAEETGLSLSMAIQSQEQEQTPEDRSERSFNTQDEEDEMKDPQEDQCNVPASPKNSNNKNQATAKTSISIKSSECEKWDAIDKDNQRPLAKRQLSDISQAFTCRAAKKTLVKEQDQTRENVQSSATQQDTRNDQMILNQHGSKRKLQKELVSSLEDFYRVDSHAISTGQEVRNMHHLI